MYNPRQPRIYKGVNGGRFASYGDPHTKKGSTWSHKQERDASRKKAKSGKQTKRRQTRDKQLSISQKARARARTANRASRGKGRLRGRHR